MSVQCVIILLLYCYFLLENNSKSIIIYENYNVVSHEDYDDHNLDSLIVFSFQGLTNITKT